MVVTALAVTASAQSVPHARVTKNALSSPSPLTWVSGSTGSDSNPCTRTAPCSTFAAALAITSPGGEVIALDAGDFGPITITKSVTISGAGGQITAASLPASNGSSQSTIKVAAGANDSVTLRNLDLSGLGASSNFSTGIEIDSAKTVHIENVRVTNFDGSGILIQNTGNITVTITDSVSSDNEYGVAALALSGSANVLIARSHFAQENIGIFGAYNVNIMVSDSDVVRGQVGYEAVNSTVDLVRSKAVDESTAGIKADSNGTIRLSDVTVANNNFAAYTASTGAIYSFGNNAFTNAARLTATIPLQ